MMNNSEPFESLISVVRETQRIGLGRKPYMYILEQVPNIVNGEIQSYTTKELATDDFDGYVSYTPNIGETVTVNGDSFVVKSIVHEFFANADKVIDTPSAMRVFVERI